MAEIIVTDDGSHTLFLNELNERYHSIHGAIAESRHVYLEAGFQCITKKKIKILEMGFGTGLNMYLTILSAQHSGKKICYTTIEKYPVPQRVIEKLNYPELYSHENRDIFYRIHSCPWDETVCIQKDIFIKKVRGDIRSIHFPPDIDLVYYDAFAPQKQPELWTRDIFKKLYNKMTPGGLLTTYTVNGKVRHALTSAGFSVVKLPGPPGKREMLRANRAM